MAAQRAVKEGKNGKKEIIKQINKTQVEKVDFNIKANKWYER